MLDKIILGFLQMKDLTAYDIKKAMENSVNYFYSSSFGSINPALKKLEKMNMVTCTEIVENNRMKKYYSITKEGKKNYSEWLKEPFTIGRIKEDSLVRLFFMGDTDKATQEKLIKEYLSELKESKKVFDNLKGSYNEKDIPKAMKERAKFQLAVLQFGIDYFEFTRKWFQKFYNSNYKQ